MTDMTAKHHYQPDTFVVDVTHLSDGPDAAPWEAATITVAKYQRPYRARRRVAQNRPGDWQTTSLRRAVRDLAGILTSQGDHYHFGLDGHVEGVTYHSRLTMPLPSWDCVHGGTPGVPYVTLRTTAERVALTLLREADYPDYDGPSQVYVSDRTHTVQVQVTRLHDEPAPEGA